ncbi:hypothetical protein QC761_608920 [Podospora bellae-mahoneyi]|uniref:Uncharacterized protein n=1 Tax=Podospora bellae-mahoneyi TaxID=2093777 RepID=A0ABR0FD88_9PEZI|nr:hypothetical protein QC761_608920 [Podospora bellae-mahoneyi]
MLWGRGPTHEFKDLKAVFAVVQQRKELEAFFHPAAFVSDDKELETIFRDAISLQVSLALQTAWWYCAYPAHRHDRPPHHAITFHDITMAGRHRTTKSHVNRVTLTISPALIKRGDSRGDDFSTEKSDLPE